MEGPEAVRMRMAELRARFAPVAPPPRVDQPGSTRRVDQPSSAASFEALMTKANAALNKMADPLPGQYANGRIPATALKSIGGHDMLIPSAADAFLALRSAAGGSGVAFSVNDSYRSFEEQVATAQKLGLYSQGGLAAKPGTSTHGLGLSVDLQLDAKAQNWMQVNAGRYGWKNDVPGEPWHWTYKP